MSYDDDRLHLVADMIVAHTRLRPPSGDCSCGDTVPLGRSFAVHQAHHILRALEQADREHDPRCISLNGDIENRIFCDCKTLAMLDRYQQTGEGREP